MTRAASSSYVRRRVLDHYAKQHPFVRNRRIMYCGGGHEGRGCDAMISVGISYWEGEHWHPEALGGSDEPPNTYPSCALCHKIKTATKDAPAIAKAFAVKEKLEGVRKTSRPMPHGRHSATKKTMSGRVVPRD